MSVARETFSFIGSYGYYKPASISGILSIPFGKGIN
jgi:hypothetical protein